jgi:hypothetical protein
MTWGKARKKQKEGKKKKEQITPALLEENKSFVSAIFDLIIFFSFHDSGLGDIIVDTWRCFLCSRFERAHNNR